jgi:hypothetical protein
MNSAAIITTLMRQVEDLRAENAWLRIARRGLEVEPQSPFPLVSAKEFLAIMHPRDTYRGRPCRTR